MNPLINGSVIVSVNDKNYTVAVVDGKGSLTLNDLAEGSYDVTATFIENDMYVGDVSDVATITVNPKYDVPMDVSADPINVGEDANVVVSVPEAINGQNITITVNGKSETVPVKDGKASAEFSDLPAGEHEITVSYAGDDTNKANSTVASLTVSKVVPETSIESTSVVAGNDVTITVTVPSDATGIVLFDVDGKNYYAPVENGKATLTLSDLPEGDYDVSYTYMGDDKYVNATGADSFEVSLNDTYEMKAESGAILVGDDASVDVILPEDATGYVVVTVDGKEYLAPVVDGHAHVSVPGLSAGDYDATVDYMGDDKYAPKSASAPIQVDKVAGANITAESEPVQADEDAVVEVTLPEDATGNVTVSVDGKNYTAPVKDGKASVSVPGLGVGNYTADVSYSGDDKYEPVSTSVPVEVDKVSDVPVDVSADPVTVGEDAVVEVTLPEDATGNVTVSVDGKNYTAPVKDGKASVSVPGLGVGNYTADVSYSGDDKYEPVSTSVPVEVDKVSDVPVDVSADPVTVGEDAVVEVTLPEDATGNVTVTVDGKNYTAPVKDGKATISIPGLGVGNHTAVITYPGDDKYDSVSEVIDISVEEEDSIVVSAPDVTKYYHGPERFYVYVNYTSGRPVVGKSVDITINGVTYHRPTGENGATSLAINLNSGVYKTTVVVDGKDTYYATVTVLPTINGTDLVKVFRNGTQYYATFRDGNGNYLADGTKVQFNINGVTYDRYVRGDKGLAKLNINLEAGDYVLTALNYETGENLSNNIKVISRLIENQDLTKYYRNASQYTVKAITEDGKVSAGESVTFNINGVFYTRTTDANGIAKLNINLEPGDYVITAEYAGCKVSNNIHVLPVLSANNLSMKYRDGSQFVATLVDGQGKPYAEQTIQFNINGVFYNRVTNSNGQAKLNINLQAGQYIITSSYNGVNVANTVTVTA